MTLHFTSLALAALVVASPAAAYEFRLSGGYFFGPGPIVPDTSLPDGRIISVEFDLDRMKGYVPFAPGAETLSDATTRVNANIEAGHLEIGNKDQKDSFWLVAVEGGPNGGTERYEFDDAMNMIWTVDLALDPGFAEGIVSVENFRLTTGKVTIPPSEQTELGIPGGYDKAGSLMSGDVLVGRVGDFDADGMLDGILVAAARVPMQSELLPGAPVGNVRGFESDIPVDPLRASEMTLRGVLGMRPLVDAVMDAGDQDKLRGHLDEIRVRVEAAQINFEDKFLSEVPERRKTLREIGWRMESIAKLLHVSWAFMKDYDYPPGKTMPSVRDATTNAFDKMTQLCDQMAAYPVDIAGHN